MFKMFSTILCIATVLAAVSSSTLPSYPSTPLAYSGYSPYSAYAYPYALPSAYPLPAAYRAASPPVVTPAVFPAPYVRAALPAVPAAAAAPLFRSPYVAAPIAAAPIAPIAPVAPVAPVVAASKIDYADAYPQYQYAYNIHDTITGDSKAQVESRDGDVVKGRYSLIEADGSRRTVNYYADPLNGFNAVVQKELPVAAAPIVKTEPAIVSV